MARPRRGGKPAPRKRKQRRLGTMLFLVGLLAVLGGTFTVGALAGRLSFRPSASMAKGGERPPKPVPPPQPELTFYRELTAPLTAPPLPAKPVTKLVVKREPAPVTPAVDGGRRPESTEPPPGPAVDMPMPAAATPDAGRYTVQVGSYNARAQAEALRARLVSSGHPAYVAEGEAGGITRYRVRIGAFTTAEEARQAAVRLASQAQVATYVTTR